MDDHPVIRQGLSRSLGNEMDMDVYVQTGSAEETLEALEEGTPDLLIADISLPGASGLELIEHLQSVAPDIPVLVVSRHDETLWAERAIRAGARGYIMKSESVDVIIRAARRVLNGGIYISERINERLLNSVAAAGKDPLSNSPPEILSDRELEVFEYLGQGVSTQDIAVQLSLSPKTVETYRTRIKDKLQLGNASELMRHAVHWVEGKEKT